MTCSLLCVAGATLVSQIKYNKNSCPDCSIFMQLVLLVCCHKDEGSVLAKLSDRMIFSDPVCFIVLPFFIRRNCCGFKRVVSDKKILSTGC